MNLQVSVEIKMIIEAHRLRGISKIKNAAFLKTLDHVVFYWNGEEGYSEFFYKDGTEIKSIVLATWREHEPRLFKSANGFVSMLNDMGISEAKLRITDFKE